MPHREPLLELLAVYRPADDADAVQRDRIAAFVRSTAACFDRSHMEGHVTGSAWLVSPGGDAVLLTHHRKLDRWLQLGGHADGEPDILAVALREAEEESGIAGIVPCGGGILDVDVHPIPARPGEPAHVHFDVRFALRAPTTDFRVSEESHRLAWVPIDRLGDYSTEPSMHRMARKWMNMRQGAA